MLAINIFKKIFNGLINYSLLLLISILFIGLFFISREYVKIHDAYIFLSITLVYLVLSFIVINRRKVISSVLYIFTMSVIGLYIPALIANYSGKFTLTHYIFNNKFADILTQFIIKHIDSEFLVSPYIMIIVSAQIIFSLLVLILKLLYMNNPALADKIKKFMDNKLEKECPVEITGNEKFEVEALGKIGTFIFLSYVLIWLVSSIFTLDQNIMFGGLFLGAGLLFILRFIYMLFPKYWKDVEKVKVIEEYFKRRFDILKHFDKNIHKKLTTVSTHSTKSYEEAMFNLYMEAWKLDADAIIINRQEHDQVSKSDFKKGKKAGKNYSFYANIVKYI